MLLTSGQLNSALSRYSISDAAKTAIVDAISNPATSLSAGLQAIDSASGLPPTPGATAIIYSGQSPNGSGSLYSLATQIASGSDGAYYTIGDIRVRPRSPILDYTVFSALAGLTPC